VQGCIHLTGAENHTVDLIRLRDGIAVFRVRDNPAEVGVFGELIDGGTCERVTEERLGEEKDEGCENLAVH